MAEESEVERLAREYAEMSDLVEAETARADHAESRFAIQRDMLEHMEARVQQDREFTLAILDRVAVGRTSSFMSELQTLLPAILPGVMELFKKREVDDADDDAADPSASSDPGEPPQ